MLYRGGFLHHAYVPMSSATARPSGLRAAAQKARLSRMISRDYRLMWRLLRRLGVPLSNIDDATQQVFLVAAERLDDIREESERAFLYGTALRVAQSFRRHSVRERAHSPHDELATTAPGPEALTEQRRACEQLDRALSALPGELRSVFVLFELEGMTSPEIASVSGLPLGTVASRLRRARERFRELVECGPHPHPREGRQP